MLGNSTQGAWFCHHEEAATQKGTRVGPQLFLIYETVFLMLTTGNPQSSVGVSFSLLPSASGGEIGVGVVSDEWLPPPREPFK